MTDLLRAVVSLVLVLGAAGVAGAQQEPLEERLRAAYELREQGDHEAARRLLQSAYDDTGSPKALAMLALAEHALRRWVPAYAHLSEALRHEHEWIDRTRPDLLRALRDIESSVALLEVRGDSGGSISIGGRPAGTIPTESVIPLVPGAHEIVVERADGTRYEVTRTIAAGERWVETVPDATAPDEAPIEPPPPPILHESAGAGAGPWVTMSLGAALAIAGGVVLGIGQAQVADIESADRGAAWNQDDADQALLLSNGGLVGVALGGAVVIAGVVWLLAASGGPEASSAAGWPTHVRF